MLAALPSALLLASLLTAQPAVAGSGLFAQPPEKSPSRSRSVIDDTGRTVTLAGGARRVLALSPALVEMVFELNAGDRLVGVVAHSDWPEAARGLPRVGDALTLGPEAILARRPDLVLAWEGGNLAPAIDRVAELGIAVYRSRVGRLEDIGSTLERLGRLLDVPAEGPASAFRARLAGLQAPQEARPAAAPRPPRVFYQVWDEPVMTINGRHVISDVIERCGGVNVFAEALPAAPTVSVEAVLAAAPDLIITSAPAGAGERADPFAKWRSFRAIPAVARDQLLLVDADRMSRPTPRMLEVAEQICAAIRAVP